MGGGSRTGGSLHLWGPLSDNAQRMDVGESRSQRSSDRPRAGSSPFQGHMYVWILRSSSPALNCIPRLFRMGLETWADWETRWLGGGWEITYLCTYGQKPYDSAESRRMPPAVLQPPGKGKPDYSSQESVLQLGQTNTAICAPGVAYSTVRYWSTVYKGLAVWHKMRPARASRRLCLETCSSVASVCIVSLGGHHRPHPHPNLCFRRRPGSLPLTSGKRQEAGTMADKHREIGNVSRMAPALFDSRVSPPGPV
jgi:hypothetical protein